LGELAKPPNIANKLEWQLIEVGITTEQGVRWHHLDQETKKSRKEFY